MIKYYAGAAVLAVVAGLGLSFLYTMQRGDGGPFDPCRVGAVSGAAEIGGPFTLVSETGETVTEKDVFTEPALVYFGYTFCPDVCPLDTVRNADAVSILRDKGHEIRTVFVTVDPERDTPEVVADFTANIDEHMLGLTGSLEQIEETARSYGAYFKKHDTDDEFYLVDHSTFSYLMLPEYGFVEFFRRDVAPEALAERMACFLDAA